MRIKWFFISMNLNPLHPRMLCVWLKLAQWFWRRGCFNFVNLFSLFRNYLPLEKGGTLHLNKVESPSPKDALCQVCFKLAQLFWRRSFLNFVNVFSLFVIISTWKRATQPFFFDEAIVDLYSLILYFFIRVILYNEN